METLRTLSESFWVRKISLSSLFLALIEAGGAVLLIFSILGLFGRMHWVADLANHPRPFYFLAGLIFLMGSLLFNQTLGIASSLIVVVLNGFLVVPYVFPKLQNPSPQDHALTLMSANALYGNYAPQEMIKTVKTVDPDILVLQEMSAANQDRVAEFWDMFPYVTDSPNRGTKEVLVFSKIPFESIEYVAHDTPWRAQAHVTFQINGQPFKLIGVHPKAPMSAGRFERRNRELGLIADDAAKSDIPVIVAGDMNITPWTPIFQRFLRDAELNDGRRRNGLNFTWAPHDVPLLIPIDQILYRGVDIHSFTSGPYTGSDHRPVIATFSVPQPAESVAKQ